KSTVGDGQGVGVKDTQVAVDSAPFTVITGTFNITAEGLHMIRWFSEDLVGNVEVVHSSSVFVDNTPPATQIAFSAPPFVSVSSQVYISSGTRISFSAQDAGSGVAFTQFQVDGGTFQRFSSSFTLAEGIHVIAFRSQDNVANLEPPQNSTVQVDGTPPVSVLQVGTPQVGLANGTLAISSQTALVIVSTDPVSNGVASGVQSILVSVDSAPFAIVSGSFTITAEGLHLLRWFARD